MDRDFIELWKEISSLKARMDAEDTSAQVLARQLSEFKNSSNEWRQALNDQRTTYVTKSEVVTIVGIVITVVGLIGTLVVRALR